MYEKDDLNELGGTQCCQLLMKTVMEEIKAIPIQYNDGDLELVNLNYTEYLTREIGVKYASKFNYYNHIIIDK